MSILQDVFWKAVFSNQDSEGTQAMSQEELLKTLGTLSLGTKRLKVLKGRRKFKLDPLGDLGWVCKLD